MWHLPFEIMGGIFEYYLSPSSNLPTNNSPGLLCLVCRDWKTVALATPALWANIVIKAQQPPHSHVPRIRSAHVRGIMNRMDRVGTYPWSLTVQASRKTAFIETEDGDLLSNLLRLSAGLYLRRLAVFSDPFTVGMGDITFPRVTSAVFHSGDDWPEVTPGLSDLPSLPSLTHAVFANIKISRYIPPQIPWSQLTHLFVDGDVSVDIRHWQVLFKLCTSLQRGGFRNSYDLTIEGIDQDPAEVIIPNPKSPGIGKSERRLRPIARLKNKPGILGGAG